MSVMGDRRKKWNTPAAIQKRKARLAVRFCLTRGWIRRAERCERCGSSVKIEAHHPDYSIPLGIEWLCYACHREHHKDDFIFAGGNRDFDPSDEPSDDDE